MKEKESPGSWVGRDKHVYQKLLQWNESIENDLILRHNAPSLVFIRSSMGLIYTGIFNWGSQPSNMCHGSDYSPRWLVMEEGSFLVWISGWQLWGDKPHAPISNTNLIRDVSTTRYIAYNTPIKLVLPSSVLGGLMYCQSWPDGLLVTEIIYHWHLNSCLLPGL